MGLSKNKASFFCPRYPPHPPNNVDSRRCTLLLWRRLSCEAVGDRAVGCQIPSRWSPEPTLFGGRGGLYADFSIFVSVPCCFALLSQVHQIYFWQENDALFLDRPMRARGAPCRLYQFRVHNSMGLREVFKNLPKTDETW